MMQSLNLVKNKDTKVVHSKCNSCKVKRSKITVIKPYKAQAQNVPQLLNRVIGNAVATSYHHSM